MAGGALLGISSLSGRTGGCEQSQRHHGQYDDLNCNRFHLWDQILSDVERFGDFPFHARAFDSRERRENLLGNREKAASSKILGRIYTIEIFG